MDKEKTIQELKRGNQIINESSERYRNHVDEILLPLVKESPRLSQLISEARQIFTTGDQKTKAKHFEVIAYLGQGPSEIHQVDEAYRYAHPDWFPFYSNVFAKCGLINKAEYPEENFIQFVDWLAESNSCNTLKMFLHGQWGRKTYNLVHLPHPYNPTTDIFEIEKINMEWWETILNRLYEIMKRKIRPVVITDYLVNAMPTHWLAQDRNKGWKGQKTYWDKDYGLWEWVDYADAEPDAIKEYREGKISRETAEEWIRQYGACRDYFVWFYDFIYKGLEKEFGKWILYHHNEVPAGAFWHLMKARIMNDYGIPKRRRITSTYGDFMIEKKEIPSNFILDFHGIRDKETYWGTRDALLGHDRTDPFIASPDGYGPHWFKDAEQTQAQAEKQYRELQIEIKKDGNMFWGNGWFYDKIDLICDFEVLKDRFMIPNRILKEVWGIKS